MHQISLIEFEIKRCGVPAALCRRIFRQGRPLCRPTPTPPRKKRRFGCYISQLCKIRPLEDKFLQKVNTTNSKMPTIKEEAKQENSALMQTSNKNPQDVLLDNKEEVPMDPGSIPEENDVTMGEVCNLIN